MVMALPPIAAGIVCLPLCAVGENGVSSDKQTIALNAHSVGQVSDWRGGIAAVWVVEFYKRVELVFRVDIAGAALEDLIRCGSLMRVDGGGPSQIGLLRLL